MRQTAVGGLLVALFMLGCSRPNISGLARKDEGSPSRPNASVRNNWSSCHMLSKSAAKAFFLGGRRCGRPSSGADRRHLPAVARAHQRFGADRLGEARQAPRRTTTAWAATLFGEGAYYAPELTKVFERRGVTFISAQLKDPPRHALGSTFDVSSIPGVAERADDAPRAR